MTRDEHRAKCLEAMRAAYRTELNSDGRSEEMRGGLRAMTAAFDSLHGIALVIDPDELSCVTEEEIPGIPLTNQPEEKP